LTVCFYLPVVSNVGCDGRHEATGRIFPIEPVSQRKGLKVLATAFKGKKEKQADASQTPFFTHSTQTLQHTLFEIRVHVSKKNMKCWIWK